jgi:signal peptidase
VRRAFRVVQTVIVTTAGLLGLLTLLAALAPLAGIQLVRLATGSMAPQYPAGSVLIVRDVDARELAVGDIATVMRADGSPVTHRIVAASPAGDGTRLDMQGDANALPDPQPYLVKRVGKVLGGAPVGGELFDIVRTPGAVPLLAGGVSALVLWAWWPVRRGPAHRAAHREVVDGEDGALA